jgi:tetraacyldisaccharide 4'-kinase
VKFFQKYKNNTFLYVKELINQKRKNRFFLFFLLIMAFFYRFVVFFRNLAYTLNLFKIKKVKAKIISIGNIDCGGVGKTPFVLFLANKLLSKYKIAIVSRGYKSRYENKFLYVDKNSNFSVLDIGDEPFLIKNRLKDISLFIGKEKLKSAKKASDLNYEILLLDDGFQYRKLKKDLEIVILNAKKPFFENDFLPRGYLRESPKNLKRADFIVVNNADNKDETLEKEIKKYTNSPIIYTRVCPNNFLDLSKNVIRIKKSSKVAVFCAIANPDLFFKTVKEMDLNIVNTLYLLDHEDISLKKLDEFVKKSLEKKAKFVIITEKDAVKLNPNIKTNIPIIYLEIILKVIANQNQMESLVENIYKLVNN